MTLMSKVILFSIRVNYTHQGKFLVKCYACSVLISDE